MKNILLTLLLLLTVSPTPSFKGSARGVEVHESLKPYFNRLVKLSKEEKLKVDWNNIESIDLAPLSTGVQGVWLPNSDVILISYYFTFPPFQVLTKEEKDDFILLCLAHEVGHSQGLKHIEKGKIGLMSMDSSKDLMVIRSLGVEQYIINTYRNELGKK
ncbi:hypothetical protein PANI_CDS0115 [Maribacter phage Panino]